MDQLFVYKERTTEDRLAEGLFNSISWMKYSKINWATLLSPTFYFLKVCCGIKPVNKYFVMDGMGNKVFSILEDSECCDRSFCANGRSFIMNVTDNSNQEVIRLVHPSTCCYGSHEVLKLLLSRLTVKYMYCILYVVFIF